MGEYGAIDPIATLILFNIFYDKVYNSKNLNNVYQQLLKKGTTFLIDVEENGVPFDIERLKSSQIELTEIINKAGKRIIYI